MMRSQAKATTSSESEDKWEVRPGGMLVQKRGSISEGDPAAAAAAAARVLSIRVKVKHAGVYHEIYISAQATFGELKRMLSARTGLHPEDQKLVFKDKERGSKSFLDTCGVKDRSKILLLEDPSAQARRLLELRRADKMEKAAKSVSRISLDVDNLASEVSALESIAKKGGKVAEDDVIRLTELLMNELIKLDAIAAVGGDLKAQRRMQVKRVQKYVEALDAISAKNAAATTTTTTTTKTATATAAAADWKLLDLLSSMPSTSSAASTATTPSAASAAAPIPRFDWELF